MRKVFRIIVFVLEAIPIPISVLSWVGTVITVAGGIGTVDWLNFIDALGAIIMIQFFIFVGLYPITYIVSILKTKKNGGLCLWSFLPIVHILIAVIFVLFLYIISCFI